MGANLGEEGSAQTRPPEISPENAPEISPENALERVPENAPENAPETGQLRTDRCGFVRRKSPRRRWRAGVSPRAGGWVGGRVRVRACVRPPPTGGSRGGDDDDYDPPECRAKIF